MFGHSDQNEEEIVGVFSCVNNNNPEPGVHRDVSEVVGVQGLGISCKNTCTYFSVHRADVTLKSMEMYNDNISPFLASTI